MPHPGLIFKWILYFREMCLCLNCCPFPHHPVLPTSLGCLKALQPYILRGPGTHELVIADWLDQMGRTLCERPCLCPSPPKQGSSATLGLQGPVQAGSETGRHEEELGVPRGLDKKQVQAMRPPQREVPGVTDGSSFLDTSSAQGQKPWVTETHIRSGAQLGTWDGNTAQHQVLLIMKATTIYQAILCARYCGKDFYM